MDEPLKSDIPRIVKKGGTIRITGTKNNRFFNEYLGLGTPPEGFTSIYEGTQPGVQGFTVTGEPIKGLTERYVEVIK